MEKEIIKKIAKAKKVNLGHFSHVLATMNERATKIFVTFASLEVIGGQRVFCGEKHAELSVMSIVKRCEFPEDYTTNGWQRLEGGAQ